MDDIIMQPTDLEEKKPEVDWERIEVEYRAGLKSLREIADGSGVSHVTVSKRAKANGWVRDLSAKIRQRSDELINKAIANKSVNNASPLAENQIVEANALERTSVHLAQRKDIQRTRSIAMQLLSELESQAGVESAGLLVQLGELMQSSEDGVDSKLQEAYQRVISLPSRAKVMKDLGESLRTLIALERQAFGLDEVRSVESFEDQLSRLLQK